MNCKSCENKISENNRYCSNCGSKIVHERISLKGTWEEFIGPFLSWDNNFWRTFIGLFTIPKDVLEAYINGARKKYFNPFSYLVLFATIAVLFYKFFPMGEIENITNGQFTSSAENQPSNPFDMKGFFDGMMNYYNFVFILMIPFMAITTYFTFYKKKNNFSEHLVFNAYIQTNLGYISLLMQLLFLNIIGINFTIYYFAYLVLAIIFSVHAFKKLYQLNAKQVIISVLKFWAILLILYIICIIIFSILFSLYMLISK
jgi:hypothetical protein